ncbi:MAG TPA: acyl-CoA synthetase FdrA [Chloroflexia bacterium]|nr:acyl-CoA synthetase FdrA [Chloroflexia bacterium]
MRSLNIVKSNRYQDSVTLMQVAVRLRDLAGIEDASLMMGTQPNKEMLAEAGLLTQESDAAGPNDLIIAMRGTEEAVEAAQGQIEDLLRAEIPVSAERQALEPHSLSAGLAALPDANLVLISTPGIYAAVEARKALLQGRHVMIFSDNVSLEDEHALKTLATERGLLLMGPDCGTAIIGGVPLGFANAIRRGGIGVVGASGTGMQEITSLISRLGGGISHAIGTGSRDLSARIRGEMTVAGLRALLNDSATSVIVVVSKPPHPDAVERVLSEVSHAQKPVVVAFLGMEREDLQVDDPAPHLAWVSTLEEAALRAVELEVGGATDIAEPDTGRIDGLIEQLAPAQRYVRGLFSGGTFCYEAMLVMQGTLGGIYSNTPLSPELALESAHHSRDHTCLDLGSDEFTVGRPHPMIDLSARAQRIMQEASDPEVAVLLLDVVLGYGAHPGPAGVLSGVIKEARERAASAGRSLAIVAAICGTDGDPQGLEGQRRALSEAGVILAPSNAAAARLAASIASHKRVAQPAENK